MNNQFLDDLFSMPVYQSDAKTDLLFFKALMKELAHHASGDETYESFLKRSSYHEITDYNSIENVPFIPVQVFKVLGNELISIDKSEITSKLSSSATSGRPSTIVLDKVTSKRQVKAMTKVMSDYIGNKRLPFIIMDVNPQGEHRNMLGARAAAVRGYLNYASSANYIVKANEAGGLEVDLAALSESYSNLDKSNPVIVFGFTYVMYESVLKPLLKIGKSFKLPVNSKVIHIGGWKKLESLKVSKEKFKADISKTFNVLPQNIIDVYGFTEQMGLNYPDCSEGWKHIPAFARVLVRNPSTHELVNDGIVGALEFLTPVPHSYPGNVVLTDDLGFVDNAVCNCGRATTRFKVVGRIKKAEVRGCGDIMGEKIKLASVNPQVWAPNHDKLQVYIAPAKVLNSNSIDEISTELKINSKWLADQSTEMLIGIIDTVSKTWLENPDLKTWKLNGLSFLVRWCSAGNLRSLLNNSLNSNSVALDQFSAIPGSNYPLWRALPMGVVSHWLAGNVPLLGMLTLVQSIITKNVNLIKLSSESSDALPALLKTFVGKEYHTPGGRKIEGHKLLDTIAVFYYHSNNTTCAEELSLNADVRLAWGGEEAVNAICSLPSRVGTKDLIFGPKTSFMVIAKESVHTERGVRRILRKVATDISSFDQSACASPHTIFIECNDYLSIELFAERLGESLERALITIPKDPETPETIVDIQTARAVGGFLGKVWKSDDYSWTVILKDQIELATPTYSRTVTVCSVDSIMEVIPIIHKGIQTIGLAAHGEKRIQFAENAAKAGALRFPEIGSMTNFDDPWDGHSVSHELVSWRSLGGPRM
jgi:hypothetical protein